MEVLELPYAHIFSCPRHCRVLCPRDLRPRSDAQKSRHATEDYGGRELHVQILLQGWGRRYVNSCEAEYEKAIVNAFHRADLHILGFVYWCSVRDPVPQFHSISNCLSRYPGMGSRYGWIVISR